MMLKCLSIKNPAQELLHSQNTESVKLKKHLSEEPRVKVVTVTSLDIIVSHYITFAGLTVVTPNGKEKLIRSAVVIS